MTTISQIIQGLTDSYQSTGTLSRILQAESTVNDNPEDIDDDEEDIDYYEDGDGDAQMKSPEPSDGTATEKPMKKRSKGPRLDRVLEDDDFIPELRLKNAHLLKYLTQERIEQMVSYIVEEPNVIMDSPQRCYKLPFVATEALCTDVDVIKSALFTPTQSGEYRVLDKIFSFVTSPMDQQKPGAAPALLPLSPLNHTLCGYFNKVVSFWLIKETEMMLDYIIQQKSIVASLFEHQLWGLTSSITDLIVRLCTVRDIQGLNPNAYKALRYEILQHCINSLQENSDDDFVTEQVFEVFTSIVRRCYQMYQPREFFDQLMSPFILQPILQFTFSNPQNQVGQETEQLTSEMQIASKQGCQFLRVLFFNMFIADPHDAMQDVMEINFGFQLTSIAGVSVDQVKAQNSQPSNEEQKEAHDKSEEEKTKEAQGEASTQSEFSAMKQEEIMKEKLLAGVSRIYELHEVNPLLAQQIVSFLPRYEELFIPQHVGGLQVSTRVKLYELLETLVSLDNLIVNIEIKDRRFCEFIMDDYERFDNNSGVLYELNRVIIAMTKQTSCFDLKVRLFKGSSSLQNPSVQLQQQQLLFRLAKKLSLSEYTLSYSKRKDIYAFIHALVKQLTQVCEQQGAVKKLLSDCEPNWTALRKALEEEDENQKGNWGERVLPPYVPPQGRAEDVIRKHEEQSSKGYLSLVEKGQVCTTKKIISSSVQSRKKMMMFDDALK